MRNIKVGLAAVVVSVALALALALALAVPVAAGPFEDGMAAHARGDYATAMRLWRPLGDQGYAGAQYNLGVMYANGRGVPHDDAAAVSWYRKAADQGYAMGQNNLGAMYENGRGVSQDYAAAVSWYRKAADQGYAMGQNNLGLMYAKGQGISQDYVNAQMWLYLAVKGGYNDAPRNRDIVATRMTTAQIAEAYKRAAEWRPKMANAAPMPSPPVPGPKPWFAPSDNSPPVAKLEPSLPQLSVPPIRVTLIPIKIKDGGTFTVPVLINNKLTLDFVVDSGASDVSIPADVVLTLRRTGTLIATDFLETYTYTIADGSTVSSQTFRIKSLKVGDKIIENVTGSVSPVEGGLLLGQSFLRRFKSWSIDNQRQLLILE